MNKGILFYFQLLFFSSVSCSFAETNTNQLPTPLPCPNCTGQITPGLRWNYVLLNPLEFSHRADVYDIDGFDNSAETVVEIHNQNGKAICYISAGTWENWRLDAQDFPKSILGKSNGWPGEKWLDIRQIQMLEPIMRARIAMCKEKGFDAIEFDNVDGYDNKTGFPLTNNDQLNYNIFLANLAHKSGLSAALKNDNNQIPQLEPYFDFAINEECFHYSECDTLLPFINANKAVLNVEYDLSSKKFCEKANAMNFSSIKKDKDLPEAVFFCN